MRVIINADDLGLNRVVNSAIDDCLSKGLVTSATIMAAGAEINGVSDIVKRYPNASFGVHLCLDEVKPLISMDKFAKFGAIDSDGILLKGWYINIKITRELLELIYEEWRAQICHVLSLGITISHLDSHHHVHTSPSLRSILFKLSSEFGINKVRLPLFLPLNLRKCMTLQKNPVELNSKQSIIKKIIYYIIRTINKGKECEWMKKTFHTTDFFCHALTFFDNVDVLARYDTIEVMCHPGHPAYQKETEMLSKFEYNNIQKISYKEL